MTKQPYDPNLKTNRVVMALIAVVLLTTVWAALQPKPNWNPTQEARRMQLLDAQQRLDAAKAEVGRLQQ
jgi:hypothetical protein